MFVCVGRKKTEWHREYVLFSQRVNACACVCNLHHTDNERKLVQNNSYSVRLIIFEGDLSGKIIKNQLEKFVFSASLVSTVELICH